MTVSLTLVGTPQESSGAVTSFNATFTTVVGNKYFIHLSTEGQAITTATAAGSSIVSGLVDSWTNTGVSNPRTYLYLYTATATSTNIALAVASANKLGIALVNVTDLSAVRSHVTNGAVSNTGSVSVPSSAGDTNAIFLSSWYPVGTITPGTGVTTLSGTGSLTGITLWVATKNGAAGTVTLDGAFTSGQWSAVGVSLQPATVVTAPTNGTISGTTSGDQRTVTVAISSLETPSATCTLNGAATVGPVAMTITGSVPNFTGTAVFSGLANGTYTPSITSGNSGGSDTDTGAAFAIELLSLTSGSYSIIASAVAFTSSSALTCPEGSLAAGTITATTTNTATISYSIIGGLDSAKFNLNASTGALTFKTAPSYSAPGDTNGDNVYLVNVQATDSTGASATQYVSVSVTSVSTVGSFSIVPSGLKRLNENGTYQFLGKAVIGGVTTNPACTWTVLSGDASISSAGLLTAGSSYGAIKIQASYSGFTATATIDDVTKDMDDDSLQSLACSDGIITGTISFSTGTGNVRIRATYGGTTIEKTFGPGASVPIYWDTGIKSQKVTFLATGLPV